MIDAALSDRALRNLAAQFLAEDVGRGDVTTLACVPSTLAVRARVVARQPLVVAGLAVARSVFLELDEQVAFEPQVAEGDRVAAATTVALVSGPARAILTGERVALNLLQRLSGIATLTRTYVDRVKGARARIIDTRKTTPGLRTLEKYAVTVGGGHNHRHGLAEACSSRTTTSPRPAGSAERSKRPEPSWRTRSRSRWRSRRLTSSARRSPLGWTPCCSTT